MLLVVLSGQTDRDCHGQRAHMQVDGYDIDILVQGYPGKTVCHGGLGWSTIVLLRGHGRIALIDVGSFNIRGPLIDAPRRPRPRAPPGHRRPPHPLALGPFGQLAALQGRPHRHRRQGAGLVAGAALGLHACPGALRQGAAALAHRRHRRGQRHGAARHHRPHRAGPHAGMPRLPAARQGQRRHLHGRCRQEPRRARLRHAPT